jgi:hypothetical protein
MFVHVILVQMMQMMEMAVVKIINMAVMANSGVPAFRAMLMSVIGMMLLGASRHDCVLSSLEPCRDHWSLFLCSLLASQMATQKRRQLFPEPERIFLHTLECPMLWPDAFDIAQSESIGRQPTCSVREETRRTASCGGALSLLKARFEAISDPAQTLSLSERALAVV